MIVQTLVEGEGDKRAIPELLRRLQILSGAYQLRFLTPIRKSRAELVDENKFRNAIQVALRQEEGCDAILVVFDADRECPRELAATLQSWARSEASHLQCEVVIATCEYEAWFLGSLESLRGKRGIQEEASSLPEPESIRGAKERLRANMDPGRAYSERLDQPALTALFDLAAAYRSCRSFRRMVRAFGLLAAATGAEIGEWPPGSWLQQA